MGRQRKPAKRLVLAITSALIIFCIGFITVTARTMGDDGGTPVALGMMMILLFTIAIIIIIVKARDILQ